MDATKDKTKEVEDVQKKRIRVTLTSRNVRNVERCANELVKRAKDGKEGESVTVKGPVRLPTKHLKMTVRKSPCGEGSKTWDRYELRIHKRVIDFVCTLTQLREITSIKIDSGVDVELNFNQDDQE